MTRPNVLWIMADELRVDALGCDSPRDPRIATPAIDTLAASGALFEQSFTASPICVPARAALATGRGPFDTGILDNEAYDQTASLDPTFPELLADAGYVTSNFGKEHLPGGAVPWQHHDPDGSGMKETIEDATAAGVDVLRTPGLGHVYAAPLPEGSAFSSSAVTTNATSALREHRRADDRPFLIRASYLQPHRPAVVPEPWASRYAGVDFEVDVSESGSPTEFERQFGRVNRGAEMEPDEIQRAVRMYYGSVAWLDEQVRLLMQTLEDAGLLDSTLVVLTTDHGATVGDGGGFGKHTFAPQSHRVPLIMSGPGLPTGVRRGDLATSEDVAPTVLTRAGVGPLEGMTGRDLFGAPAPQVIRSAIGYGETWSRAFPNRDAGRWTDGRGWPQRVCVRTRRYRLDGNTRIDGEPVDLAGPDADLFLADTLSDPTERTNLVDDPRHVGIRETLVEELDAARRQLEQVETLTTRTAPAAGFGAV